MGSVRIFRKSGIGLDYYKGKEFMSRVVRTLTKGGIDQLIYRQKEQDEMELFVKQKERITFQYPNSPKKLNLMQIEGVKNNREKFMNSRMV